MQSGEDAELPVTELLERLSAHLSTLAGQARLVERVAGQIGRDNGCFDRAAMRDIQAIDHLRQSIDDLVGLTGQLARLPIAHRLRPGEVTAILQALTLGHSRALLRPQEGADGPPSALPEQGEAQFF